MSPENEGFIPPHGDYEDLLSFRKARIIYDGIAQFCQRLLEKRDRTYDQMGQAARSGRTSSKGARPLEPRRKQRLNC